MFVESYINITRFVNKLIPYIIRIIFLSKKMLLNIANFLFLYNNIFFIYNYIIKKTIISVMGSSRFLKPCDERYVPEVGKIIVQEG